MISEDKLRAITIGEPARLDGPVVLVEYRAEWPGLYAREEARIRRALGGRALLVEHAGSTSVPGLVAKPIIDVVLVVADSADEPAFLPALVEAGYALRIREPGWHEHRMLRGRDTDVNVHVFGARCPEVSGMVRFRDRLRDSAEARDRYACEKRALARRRWRYVQDYADAPRARSSGDPRGRLTGPPMIACAMRAVRHVMSVVGTRPNFMKTAPVIAALSGGRRPVRQTLVHTEQHYDDAMSQVFVEQLGVGAPDHVLAVGSGSHATQTARVLERIEPILEADRPDILLVPGDVNSTLAAALVAAKLSIPIGHIEAGLRSFDRSMPEEVNRILTDQLSSLLFIHSPEARANLLREGCGPERIHAVGNTMIDTLVAMRPRVEALEVAGAHGLRRGEYLLVTLHRPALVDGPLLADAMAALDRVAADLPVVFPMHPRTAKAIRRQGIPAPAAGVRVLEPLGYLEFLSLLESAAGALTDSGGIQEETTYLGVPCFTLRDNTERPVTCESGTNTLLGLAPRRIAEVPERLAAARSRAHVVPVGWDGRAAERIVAVLEDGVPEWRPPGVSDVEAPGRPAAQSAA